jgi:hypothetical protein
LRCRCNCGCWRGCTCGTRVAFEFIDARALGVELLAHCLDLLGQFRDGLCLRRQGTERRADGEGANT